jgi:hypothetical protein
MQVEQPQKKVCQQAWRGLRTQIPIMSGGDKVLGHDVFGRHSQGLKDRSKLVQQIRN